MIFSPPILALVTVSVLLAGYALYAAGSGLFLLAGWDARSPSWAQLRRERKTALLSSLLGVIMVGELLCLLLFVVLADHLHGFFTGAMCAAGTLNANAYGNAALLVTLLGFFFSALWLVVNHLDTLTPDFALLRVKYLWLVPVALVLGAQAVLLTCYFTRLNPTLITSCCAVAFGEDAAGISSELAHLPPKLMQPLFWGTLLATLGAGLLPTTSAGVDKIYAGLSLLMLPLGLASIISFISVRIYELPTHHCPFCLLQQDYNCIGYLLYSGLFLGTALGMGTGLVRWLGARAPLRNVAPGLARCLKFWSLAGYVLLGLVAFRPLLCSDFRM